MKLRQIEVFHAVYVTGSVSGGARALNVSQPTVSKVLKHTEDRLGFALFDRVSGRLIPTEKGIALFSEIEPVFHKLNELSRYTSMLANTKTGRLRFAMTPAFSLEVAPIALAQFSKAHPDVTIEVETLHANQVVKALANNQIDIGLVFDAPKYPGIEAKTIARTEFLCVAPEGQYWQSEQNLRLEDLENYPLITLNEKSVLGQILSRKLKDAFKRPLDSKIVVETYHIAKRLVRQGAGIAVIDAVTAYSGDTTGLQFQNITPPIKVKIDIITRLNEPTVGFRSEFIENFRAAMTAFQTQTGSA